MTIDDLFARYGPAYRWFAVVTALMGTISTILSSTIINVALPDIMGAFGIGQDVAQWLSTAFLASMTGTMLLNAWMVQRFGQRFTFQVALSVFLVGSVLGGLAPGENLLILGRVLQGMAAGLAQPLAMLTIFKVFPADRRGQAMGIYGIGVILAPALGPVLGGWLVDSFNWRYVFFMSVPFCALGLPLGALFMPGAEQEEGAGRFDWLGLFLLATFLITLLTGLSNGQSEGWHSLEIEALLAVAVLSGVGLVIWELRCPAPMLALRLFRNPRFAAGCAVMVIMGVGLFGSTYLIPLFVQTIQGYTPTRSGLLLMPAGLVLAVVFPLAGQLSDRVAPRWPSVIGLSLFAYSAWLMTGVGTDTPFWTFAYWITLGRVGLGLLMPAVMAGAMRSLSGSELNHGSGMVNFLRQLGGAFGVNLLAVRLERDTFRHGADLAATQTPGNGATAELLGRVQALYQQSGLPEALAAPMAGDYLARTVYIQANLLAYRDGFLLVALIFALGLIPAWLMGMRFRGRLGLLSGRP